MPSSRASRCPSPTDRMHALRDPTYRLAVCALRSDRSCRKLNVTMASSPTLRHDARRRLSSGILFGVFLLLVCGGDVHALPKTFESLHSPNEVSADLDPDSEFWRNAPAVFAESNSWGEGVPGGRLEIRSRWTDENIYFLFICPFDELNLKPDPKTEVETQELWKWDVAEVFIGSDFKNIRRYREFEVSPQGEWIDLDVDLDTPHHEDGWRWNSGFQSAARIDRNRGSWYAFMRIPYAAIDATPAADGNLLRVNFFLSEGPANRRRQIAWQPTHEATFHVPEVFGTLRLISDPAESDRQTRRSSN